MTATAAYKQLTDAYVERTGQTEKVAKVELATALAAQWARQVGGEGLASLVIERATRPSADEPTLPGIDAKDKTTTTTKPKGGKQ